MYINLSKSGYNLTKLKYNASSYLIKISENLTIVDGAINKSLDLENLMDLLNSTEYLLDLNLDEYNLLREEINQYELYVPER